MRGIANEKKMISFVLLFLILTSFTACAQKDSAAGIIPTVLFLCAALSTDVTKIFRQFFTYLDETSNQRRYLQSGFIKNICRFRIDLSKNDRDRIIPQLLQQCRITPITGNVYTRLIPGSVMLTGSRIRDSSSGSMIFSSRMISRTGRFCFSAFLAMSAAR